MNQYISNIKPRLDYIDIAKALGMFTIIWGHIIHEGWSNQMVYAFHIPLFFFMSGMVFKAEKYATLWKLIKRRIKTLLLPYLIFSLVTWVLWVGMRILAHDSTDYLYPLLQTFIAQGSSGYLRHNLPLWFVTCLFAVEILYYVINKLPKLSAIITCVIVSVLGCYLEMGGGSLWVTLPWSFDGALVALLFYGSGYWLIGRVSHERLQQVIQNRAVFGWSVIVILIILLYFSSICNGYVTIGSNKLGKSIALFYLNSYVGIVTMILFSVYLSGMKFTGYAQKVKSFIKWFGQNSFYAMATHFPIKELLGRLVDKIFHCNVHTDIEYATLVFIITLIMDSFVVWGCCLIKQKWNIRKKIISFS